MLIKFIHNSHIGCLLPPNPPLSTFGVEERVLAGWIFRIENYMFNLYDIRIPVRCLNNEGISVAGPSSASSIVTKFRFTCLRYIKCFDL